MIQKHIVVVDGLWVGHHPIYVKIFVKILLDAGYQVSVFCPAPEEVTHWVNQTFTSEGCRFRAHYFADLGPWLWIYCPSKIRYALSSLSCWFHVSRSLKKLISFTGKPDFVFFAWVDSYLYGYLPVRLIDWQFPFLWSGLYFHPSHLRALNGDGKPRKARFAPPENFIAHSRWASSIAVLDAGIANALRSKLLGKPIVVLPDFSDEIPPLDRYGLAEQIKAEAKGRQIIGLLGGLSRRKGLLTLIRIVKQSVTKDWYFVFAGILMEQTFSKVELTEIKLFFNAKRENCFFHLDKIPLDAQFNALVNVCDVLFAMYEDFPHSSNLVTKSALYGKRVLVSTGGYMEEVVRRYKLGDAVPAGDIQGALTALYRLTADDDSLEDLAGMKEYAGEQSQAKLQEKLLQLVENSIRCATSKGNIPNNSEK